jgi:hypothetical protein
VDQQSGLPESWKVQLPVFEGPLDLLLHLVKINEVEITDIPVGVICDQFYEYLQLMEELNLDVAADYCCCPGRPPQTAKRGRIPDKSWWSVYSNTSGSKRPHSRWPRFTVSGAVSGAVRPIRWSSRTTNR